MARKQRLAFLIGLYLMYSAAPAFAAEQALTLSDSVGLALQNNPSIKIAAADQEKAFWGISEAKSGLLPTVTLNNSDTHGKATQSNPFGDTFSNSVRLTMPLYTGGRVEGLINQAKLGEQAANLGVDKAKQQVQLDAKTAYYGVLQAHDLVDVNQQTVATLTEHLKNVQDQFNAGTMAKADVLRSEVELANAKQNLIKAQNALDIANTTLNNVIGLSPDTSPVLTEHLSYEKYDVSLEDCLNRAHKNRPEVLQSDTGIKAANAGVKIAESGKLPTVTFSGATGWSDTDFPGMKNNTWSLNLSASWNIFDSGLTNAKVKEANTGVDKAVQQAKQTGDAIDLEVRQAYLGMTEAEKRIDTSKTAIAKAEEDLKIARVKYYSGVGTNLDVIDAQLALTQAKTNYTQALYDYNVGKAKLDKATGDNTGL